MGDRDVSGESTQVAHPVSQCHNICTFTNGHLLSCAITTLICAPQLPFALSSTPGPQ